MHILVTGCAGFIGAEVVKALLARGDYVVGIDNLNDYYDVRLKEHRLAILKGHSAFWFHHYDVEDTSGLTTLFASQKFDAVVNLAARAGVRASAQSPRVYLTTNVGGTLNLLELMAEHNVSQFVMASTSSLYAGVAMPFSETSDVTRPISPYAATKLAAESLVHTWHHLYGINAAILRYFTVFGPAGRPDMSPFRFIEWIRRQQPVRVYGDGTQQRDFTYIDDIVAGTTAALAIKGCEVINLGGGQTPWAINEMIACIEEETGRKALIEQLPPSALDLPDTFADISKAKSILGWKPCVTTQNGFRRTVAWHMDNAHFLDKLHPFVTV